MISFNLKVLAKFVLCMLGIVRKNYMLVLAQNIFATARILVKMCSIARNFVNPAL